MSAVDSASPNGYDHEAAPTPGELPPDLSGGSENDADLFGDDDDDLPEDNDNGLDRKLDDSELDSGDDEDRADRVAATIEDDEDGLAEHQELRLLNADMARIKPPEGDELYLLNMPPFLGLKHRNFDPATFEAPTQPHDGRDPATDPTVKFSPFSTAASTMYWRRDPKNSEQLQSNSRIIRWSDGSLTLQVASKPQDHYRISTTALRSSFGRKRNQPQPDYDPNKDTHNYLAAPHITQGIDLQIVAPLDAAMRIQPTGDLADESVLKLQQSLAAATQAHDPLAALKQVKEDPELAKKAAEMFEKDRMRTARKREAAEDRLLLRKDRVLGRSGLGGRSGGPGGLSVAGLEDDDGMPTARGTKSSKGARRRKQNRRGDIYSDDEDEDLPRGRTREDEYDREDDFLAASDEEPETYEDDDEEEVLGESDSEDPDVDDLEIEGKQTAKPDRERERREREIRRATTPKRAAESDADAEDDGDGDGGAAVGAAGGGGAGGASPQSRKKRRVIDDDDEEE